MENELNEKRVRIEENFEKLPKKAQQAICWVIENWDSVTEMCMESNMTCEEIEKYKKKADEEGDYVLFVLICIV